MVVISLGDNDMLILSPWKHNWTGFIQGGGWSGHTQFAGALVGLGWVCGFLVLLVMFLLLGYFELDLFLSKNMGWSVHCTLYMNIFWICWTAFWLCLVLLDLGWICFYPCGVYTPTLVKAFLSSRLAQHIFWVGHQSSSAGNTDNHPGWMMATKEMENSSRI